MNIISKYNTKDILIANNKLVENIMFEKDDDYDKKELHENIATLIFTPKTPKNIDTILEAKAFIVDYIINNKEKQVSESVALPNSLVSTIMVEKYNQKYADLDETEKEVLKSLIDSDDTTKKEIYSKTIRECIDLINGKLVESSLDAKEKLLQVKDKLLNDKQEVNEDYTKNISKLVELRNSLKQN